MSGLPFKNAALSRLAPTTPAGIRHGMMGGRTYQHTSAPLTISRHSIFNVKRVDTLSARCEAANHLVGYIHRGVGHTTSYSMPHHCADQFV